MTWEEARQSCKDQGGELASIEDPNTNNFLKKLTANRAWIGGHLVNEEENIWGWTDSTSWNFDNWYDLDSIYSEAKVHSYSFVH